LIGLRAFLKLATDAHMPDPPEVQEWPTLLWLAHTDVCRDQILHLWQRALNTKAVRDAALHVLLAWLRSADACADIYPAVTQLLADLMVAGDEREQARLHFHLSRWAAPNGQPSAAAGDILAAIDHMHTR